jgi:hypothetical protein
MASRGITDAQDILDQMTELEYWDQAQSGAGSGAKSSLLSKADILIEVVYAHAIAEQECSARKKVLAELAEARMLGGDRYQLDLARLRAVAGALRNDAARVPTTEERRRLDEAGDRILKTLGLTSAAKSSRAELSTGDETGVPHDDLSLDDVRELIKKGDASAVHTLRRWLAEDIEAERSGSQDRKLIVAIEGLAAFHDHSALERLKTLYGRGWRAPSAVPSVTARAIAALSSSDELDLLIDITQDRQLLLSARCEAAAGLVRLDDDLGRQFLMEQYDLYRLERSTTNRSGMEPVRRTLENLDDSEIVSALRGRLPIETDERMRKNISTLIDRMTVNGETIDTLKSYAADTSWSKAYRRYAAISALGRRGTPDLIPFLRSLKPMTGTDVPNAQKTNFKQAVDDTVAEIQRRHWNRNDALADGGADKR